MLKFFLAFKIHVFILKKKIFIKEVIIYDLLTNLFIYFILYFFAWHLTKIICCNLCGVFSRIFSRGD